jgi:hypothetical protein
LRFVNGRRAAMAIGTLAGVAAALVAAVVARGSLRVCLRAGRIALGGLRIGYAAATLQLLRRCPDCRRLIRRDARACRHCGWRRRPGHTGAPA